MINVIAASCLCADIFDATREIRPGGEALNFAASLCRYDHIHIGVMGAIADDEFGEQIITAIDSRPIDRSSLHIVSRGITANHRIYLTEEGDRYFKPDSWTGGVYPDFSLTDADIATLQQADIVHLNHTSSVFDDMIRLQSQMGYKISADFNVDDRFDILERIAPHIDFFFISAAGREDVICRLFDDWSRRYDGIFIATFAEKGSSAFCRGVRYDTTACPVSEVIDTTGCGDSYQAGFIGEFTRSGNIAAALREGSVVAAMTLSHIGGLN